MTTTGNSSPMDGPPLSCMDADTVVIGAADHQLIGSRKCAAEIPRGDWDENVHAVRPPVDEVRYHMVMREIEQWQRPLEHFPIQLNQIYGRKMLQLFVLSSIFIRRVTPFGRMML